MEGAGAFSSPIGQRIRRKEDPRFLTGKGRYIDDLTVTGVLHIAFVRSPIAHGRIVSVDTSAAEAVPGVLRVFTAEDIAAFVRPIRATSSSPGYMPCDMPVLATDRVRYVGEPIAAVVAVNRYCAEDGVDAVMVEYEPLPAVVSMEAALSSGAEQIHDEVPGNLFNSFHVVTGDPDSAFEDADLIVELELSSQRCAPVALECRSVIADFNVPDGELTIWVGNQAPHLLRTGLSRHLDLPENRIRVISPDVGGGFGGKLILYREELTLAAVSRSLGRPVKWVSDRREDLQSTLHGRQQTHRISGAFDKDGKVHAIKIEIDADNGAYAIWPMTAALDSGQASENVVGPYAIAHYERTVRAVVTNKVPMGPYRGVGRPMACFSIERLMDEAARKLELDPLEIRRRNLVTEFPYDTAGGLRLDSGSYIEALDLIAERLDYTRLRQEQASLRERGIHRGIGIACMVEHTALGPQEVAKKGVDIGFGYDTALVRVEPDGKLTVAVGLHSHGQGQETSIAQIAAAGLGLGVDDVNVIFGDTAVVPYGMGTWASRSTVYCGGATILAAETVREKMLGIAADMLEVDAADLVVANGRVTVRGVAARYVTVADVARRANHEPHLLPPGMEPGLEAMRRYMAPDPGSFASSIHAAVVDVDVATGQLQIQKYVIVEDCGNMVNPLIVDGQIHGGVAQGLGHALLEDIVYSEEGQPLSSSLMDYLLPTFLDVPAMEVNHLTTPSPFSEGGFKGMGEGGVINVPAVLANAVTDALAPYDVHVNRTPITPTDLLHAINQSRQDNAARARQNNAS